MKLIKLTRPDGSNVLFNIDYISILMPNDGAFEADVKTIILAADGSKHGVKETEAEIETLML